MDFKTLDRNELDETRSKWESDIDLMEESSEVIRPSLYWSALDAAAARVTGGLESLQFGLFLDNKSYASALVAVHHVNHGNPPYLKIREIRLEPSLSYEIDESSEGNYFARHRQISEILGAIFAEVIALADCSSLKSDKIKIYGSTSVEIEMFAQVVMHAEDIENRWKLRVSTHGHWLQFEKL